MERLTKPFNPHQDNVAANWEIYHIRHTRGLLLTQANMADATKLNWLLQNGGEELEKKYNEVKAVGDTYNEAIAKLTRLFNSPVNHQLGKFHFGELKHFDGESFDEFLCRLREAIKSCGYATAAREDEALMDRIIHGCSSEKLRDDALAA
jgi:hypothetical protein